MAGNVSAPFAVVRSGKCDSSLARIRDAIQIIVATDGQGTGGGSQPGDRESQPALSHYWGLVLGQTIMRVGYFFRMILSYLMKPMRCPMWLVTTWGFP